VFHHLPVSDAHDIDKPNFQDIYSGCCTELLVRKAQLRGSGAPQARRGRRALGGRRPPRPRGQDSGDLHSGPHARSRQALSGATEGSDSGRRADGGGGCLNGPNPPLTLDMRAAVRSIGKLADLELGTIVCYHGSVVGEDANKQLRRVIQEVPRERDE
jgi:hypothetical protein